MKIFLVSIFLVIFPAFVLAGGHEDRQDNRTRVAYDAIGVVTDEVMNLKTRVKALETAPRQAVAPRNGNGGSHGVSATVQTAVDVDVREAFFVREGVDADVARAAATTRDHGAGRSALLSVARKGAEREVATLEVLDKLSRAQAQTSFVLERSLGKKYSRIAKDYGFK